VDALSFIRENAALTTPPLVPEVALHLAVEALPLWEKTEEELQAIGLPPPYWAFAWAGGQALARYVLDHPELVAGRSVLDVASGSGLVAIAAMKAGALRVEATEIDAIACAAIAANAEANGAAIRVAEGDPIGRDVATDVVLVGDAFYEKPLADRLLPWLERLAERGASVLIGDPGRSYFPKERFELIASYEVPVTRALEDAEIKRTSVWRLGGIRCPTPSLELVKRGKV
jgi:predicted nicotinamide N-methyase